MQSSHVQSDLMHFEVQGRNLKPIVAIVPPLQPRLVGYTWCKNDAAYLSLSPATQLFSLTKCATRSLSWCFRSRNLQLCCQKIGVFGSDAPLASHSDAWIMLDQPGRPALGPFNLQVLQLPQVPQPQRTASPVEDPLRWSGDSSFLSSESLLLDVPTCLSSCPTKGWVSVDLSFQDAEDQGCRFFYDFRFVVSVLNLLARGSGSLIRQVCKCARRVGYCRVKEVIYPSS